MATTATSPSAPAAQYAALQQQDISDTNSFENRLPPDAQSEKHPEAAHSQSMASEAKRNIAIGLSLILLPMLGLSALLLGLILANRVPKQSGDLSFTQRSDTDGNAYYVDFNATALATISSWSATVAPLLAAVAMSLASFPISRKFKDNSLRGSSNLPTPFQFSMLLESLTGSVSAFFSFGKYRLWPHKAPIASLVRLGFFVLAISTILGYAITGIDTWLHLVIQTVSVDIASSRTPSFTYGRGMSDVSCVDDIQNFDLDSQTGTCIITRFSTGYYLADAAEAYKALGNLSTINAVRTVQVNDQTIAYLGPASIPHNVDYQATTLGIGTQCMPISHKCKLRAETGSTTPFHCNAAFFGDLSLPSISGIDLSTNNQFTQPTTGLVWFNDAALTRFANSSIEESIPRNPYHLGVWALTQQATVDGTFDDPNIINPLTGGLSYLLNCTTTVYDLKYSWIDGSVRSADLSKANATMGSSLQYPSYLNLAKAWMDVAAYGAGAEADSRALARAWSTSYSKVAMGLTAGALSNRTNVVEQVRETRLVSRVPKVPLYFLIALNIVYAILGVVLAFVALTSKPDESNDVRERINIVGLVAYAFEGHRARRPVENKRQMFAEYSNVGSSKIGLEQSMYDGWEYTVTSRSTKAASPTPPTR